MIKLRYILIVFLAFAIPLCAYACAFQEIETKSDALAENVDHTLWNQLLQKNVTLDGWVDYKGFVADSLKLNQYLTILENNHPDEKKWAKNDQLAYWINAYNAFTIRLIIRNYPVESIKDIAGSIPFINTPWDIKFSHIGKETYDLNNIEHGIVRKKFDEPRIHFALNCASNSCPPLRNEAFLPNKLEEQLADQAKNFINDSSRNKLDAQKPELSKIFTWFKGDFKDQMPVIDFINQYAETKLSKDADLEYMDYDWRLNDLPK